MAALTWHVRYPPNKTLRKVCNAIMVKAINHNNAFWIPRIVQLWWNAQRKWLQHAQFNINGDDIDYF